MKKSNRWIRAGKYAEKGYSNADIADLFDVDDGTVSKWLKDCVRAGYLKPPQPNYTTGPTPFPSDVADIENDSPAEQFRDALWQLADDCKVRRIWRVHVVETPSRALTGKLAAYRRDQFCAQVAQEIQNEIGRSSICGVAWGETLKSLISAMKPLKPKLSSGICFVPVRGDPIGTTASDNSPSMLVNRLDSLFNRTPNPISLVGVPALIPDGFSAAEQKTIQRYAEKSAAYQNLFATRRGIPLCLKMDCVITTIGNVDMPGFGVYTKECIKLWGLPPNWLESNVIGDIAGVFLPKSGSLPTNWTTLINRWLGLKEAHLKKCVDASSEGGSPGVIVVAWGGAERAQVIVRAAQLGLVSQLFIDRELAKEINKII